MALQSTLITTGSPSECVIYDSTGTNAITSLIVCNSATYNPASPTDGLTYLSLWAVASGDAKGNVNMIVNALPIPAGETVSFDSEKLVLDDGDMIIANSTSPTNLSATVSSLPV